MGTNDVIKEIKALNHWTSSQVLFNNQYITNEHLSDRRIGFGRK